MRVTGIHILFSTVKYLQTKMYCQKIFLIPLNVETMSNNQFFWNKKFLHLEDNSSDHYADGKLCKIDLDTNAVKKKYLSLLRAHGNTCINRLTNNTLFWMMWI